MANWLLGHYFLAESLQQKTGVFFQPISMTKVTIGAVRSLTGLEYNKQLATGVLYLRT